MDNLLNSLKIIDKIESTRKSNNSCWMDLVRLCFALDPDLTKGILKRIIQHDEEVIKSFKELVDG